MPKLHQIVMAASLLCTLPILAQDNAPKPVPPMEEAMIATIPRPEPQVTFADGKLQIVARNASLASLFDAIRSHSGATITAPTEVLVQQVNVKVGPAAVMDVITQVLDAADCDYIVAGSAAKPSSVRVAAMPKAPQTELAASMHQPDAKATEASEMPQSDAKAESKADSDDDAQAASKPEEKATEARSEETEAKADPAEAKASDTTAVDQAQKTADPAAKPDQGGANLSQPGNKPESSIVTLPGAANKAESNPSPKEPEQPATEAETGKPQSTPAPK